MMDFKKGDRVEWKCLVDTVYYGTVYVDSHPAHTWLAVLADGEACFGYIDRSTARPSKRPDPKNLYRVR
jgi:hypothetical protein